MPHEIQTGVQAGVQAEEADDLQTSRYIVQHLIGSGGMAEVYLAEHRDLGTLHAMKVLRIAVPSLQHRLMLEGRLQAGLSHPNVISVTDVVRTAMGVPALIMEYINGPSLHDALNDYRPTLVQIDSIAMGLLAGVEAAHARGMVHRDLKPENVLLSLANGSATAKITDFGLAKVFGDTMRGTNTRSGMALGTAKYMAPEQFRNAKDVDHRADIFSMGTILYRLATGRQAFRGEDFISVYREASAEGFVPVGKIAPHLPLRMRDAIEAALKPAVEDRPQTIAELRERWTKGMDAHPAYGVWAPHQLEFLAALEPSSAVLSAADSLDSLDSPDSLENQKTQGFADTPNTPSQITVVGPSLCPFTEDALVSAMPPPMMLNPGAVPNEEVLQDGEEGSADDPPPWVPPVVSRPLMQLPVLDDRPAKPLPKKKSWLAAALASGVGVAAAGALLLGGLMLASNNAQADHRMATYADAAIDALPLVPAPTIPEIPASWLAVEAGEHTVGKRGQVVPTRMLVRELNWHGPTIRGENPGFPRIPASPVHEVTLQAARLAPAPLTWAGWTALGGEAVGADDAAVTGVGLKEIERVLNAASIRDGLEPALTEGSWNGANGYRLPTEAEWELVLHHKKQPLERVIDPEARPYLPGRGTPSTVRRGNRDVRVLGWSDPQRTPFRLARLEETP